ncbi:MAG: hypothetical protein EBR09_08960 [Proteobacteria bacterium]|nr:hypothetical protein [Pseudomonadota bacterium]
MRAVVFFAAAVTLNACSFSEQSTAICKITIFNNSVSVHAATSTDVKSKDDCRQLGADAFRTYCLNNASVEFAEASNLTNRYEWNGPKSGTGERDTASGSFGSAKCGMVQ